MKPRQGERKKDINKHNIKNRQAVGEGRRK